MSKSKFMVRLDHRVEDERMLAELYDSALPGRKHDVMLELLIAGYRVKFGDQKPTLFPKAESKKSEPSAAAKEVPSNGHHKHAVKAGDQGNGTGLTALMGDQQLNS